MKLYKISQHVNRGYDTYDSAVVAAPDEDAARLIHPDGYTDMSNANSRRISCSDWCPDLSKIDVEYLGEATEGIKQGVICASFNAG